MASVPHLVHNNIKIILVELWITQWLPCPLVFDGNNIVKSFTARLRSVQIESLPHCCDSPNDYRLGGPFQNNHQLVHCWVHQKSIERVFFELCYYLRDPKQGTVPPWSRRLCYVSLATMSLSGLCQIIAHRLSLLMLYCPMICHILRHFACSDYKFDFCPSHRTSMRLPK